MTVVYPTQGTYVSNSTTTNINPFQHHQAQLAAQQAMGAYHNAQHQQQIWQQGLPYGGSVGMVGTAPLINISHPHTFPSTYPVYDSIQMDPCVMMMARLQPLITASAREAKITPCYRLDMRLYYHAGLDDQVVEIAVCEWDGRALASWVIDRYNEPYGDDVSKKFNEHFGHLRPSASKKSSMADLIMEEKFEMCEA